MSAGAGIGIGAAIGLASFTVAGLLAAWVLLRRRKRVAAIYAAELSDKRQEFRAELHHSTTPVSWGSESDLYQLDGAAKQELEADLPPIPPPKSPVGNGPTEIGTNSLYEYGSSNRRSPGWV